MSGFKSLLLQLVDSQTIGVYTRVYESIRFGQRPYADFSDLSAAGQGQSV
jgi:hypothetical protein